eukprot:13383294-Heterocapsa_arctica.AAC.1
MRTLAERAVEWCIPLYAATVDMKKALDSLTQSAVHVTLSQSGVPPSLRLLILNEMVDLKIIFSGDGVSSAPLVGMQEIPQGDPCSALLFAATADRVFAGLEPERQATRGCGFAVD